MPRLVLRLVLSEEVIYRVSEKKRELNSSIDAMQRISYLTTVIASRNNDSPRLTYKIVTTIQCKSYIVHVPN